MTPSTPVRPLSHTTLETFEQCPRKAWHLHVARDTPKIPYAPGVNVHEALEARLRHGTPLPASLQHVEPMVQVIIGRAGDRLVIEQRYAVTRDWVPCDPYDAQCWLRGAVDVAILGPSAWFGDWKSGKVREKPEQLDLYATLAMLTHPEVDAVTVCNLWIGPTAGAGKVGVSRSHARGDMHNLIGGILRRTQPFEEALKRGQGAFGPKRTPLCAWCPVKQCSFNTYRE